MLKSFTGDFSGFVDIHFRSPVSGTSCPLHSERGGKDPKQRTEAKPGTKPACAGCTSECHGLQVARGVLAQTGEVKTRSCRRRTTISADGNSQSIRGY